MDDLIGHSITYRVAVGPRAGQKVFALQTVPARAAEPKPGVAQGAGFSLHAGLGVEPDQRSKLERLARYVSRPPVAVERLALTAQGQVRYRLKTPYRDGTTHIVLEPLDFLARLAALRAAVTPAGRGPGAGGRSTTAARQTPRHLALTWDGSKPGVAPGPLGPPSGTSRGFATSDQIARYRMGDGCQEGVGDAGNRGNLARLVFEVGC
jgi:hypothetical protein